MIVPRVAPLLVVQFQWVSPMSAERAMQRSGQGQILDLQSIFEDAITDL